MQKDFCLSSTGEVFQFQATIPAKLIEREDWKLMQFTGLLDKNGKEIYEGDVVTRAGAGFATRRNTVSYMDSGFSPFAYDDFGDEGYAASSCEVIGNIYENPELLK